MTFRLARSAPATAAAIALSLLAAGCNRGKPDQGDGGALDKELTGNRQADPAINSALEDQIMVDPALTQQRDGGARVGAGQSPVPATLPGAGAAEGRTLGEAAQDQAAGKAGANAACYRALQYSAGWAHRLPAALPLPVDAQVREAAGNTSGGCNVRVVSFASPTPITRLADFYTAAGRRGGYAVEATADGENRAVGGDKGADAFYATLRPRTGGGTEIDIVTNHGR
jgi:hypothetical protein